MLVRTRLSGGARRGLADELSNGMVLKPAVKYQRIAHTKGLPRHNH